VPAGDGPEAVTGEPDLPAEYTLSVNNPVASLRMALHCLYTPRFGDGWIAGVDGLQVPSFRCRSLGFRFVKTGNKNNGSIGPIGR
jgi:hypothetical protein